MRRPPCLDLATLALLAPMVFGACGARSPLPLGDRAGDDDGGASSGTGDGGSQRPGSDGGDDCGEACGTPGHDPPLRPMSLAAGVGHTCASTRSAGLRCWGTGELGELGDGASRSRDVPVAVRGFDLGVTAVAANFGHTCAITRQGAVACWGHNYFGELGDGTVRDHSQPFHVQTLTDAISVTAGVYHSCAVRADGVAFCWGNNHEAQLGNGTIVNTSTPIAVQGPPMIAIAAGETFTCGLTKSAKVMCWGDDSFGQIGDDSWGTKTTPVEVVGLADVIAISAGSEHACALTRSGDVHCWGGNQFGALGDGTIVRSARPVRVIGLSGPARAIATAERHTCALLAGGALACWGINTFGELGDGSFAPSMSPVLVRDLGGAPVAIAAGEGHVCVLRADDHVRCWGWNELGQLGDGTTTNRALPTPVVGL